MEGILNHICPFFFQLLFKRRKMEVQETKEHIMMTPAEYKKKNKMVEIHHSLVSSKATITSAKGRCSQTVVTIYTGKVRSTSK
jgi:hypothetical protein